MNDAQRRLVVHFVLLWMLIGAGSAVNRIVKEPYLVSGSNFHLYVISGETVKADKAYITPGRDIPYSTGTEILPTRL